MSEHLQPTMDDDAKLHQLLDSAIMARQWMKGKEEFMAYCQEMKRDKTQFLTASSMTVIRQLPHNQLTTTIFYFMSPKVCEIWEACLHVALQKLKVAHSINQQPNRIDCDFHESKDVERVFEMLKPLVQRTVFERVTFSFVQPAIFDTFSNIFKGKTIRKVDLNQDDFTDNDAIIRFVNVVSPSIVMARQLGQKKDIAEFLLPLADLVETIVIANCTDYKIDLSIVKRMLSRKCQYLNLYKNVHAISLSEAEKLIQFFHHLDKAVVLQIPTNIESFEEIQIGEYTINTIGQLIQLIEHQSLNGRRMSFNLIQFPDEDDIKLRQLLDYALEHQQEDRDQFTTLCEELMKDRSKRLIVNAIGVERIERRGHRKLIVIESDCPNVRRLWKACLDAAFSKLKLALSCGQEYNSIEFYISNSEDVEKVFGIMLPLVQRTDFERMLFSLVKPPIIYDIFSKIFNGKTVRKVELKLEDSVVFDEILRLVRVVRPSIVKAEQFGDTVDSATFLLPLADLVETIAIRFFIDNKKKNLLIVKEMLSRKCKHLHVYGYINLISLNDVERFAQFFHHLEKPVALLMPPNRRQINSQVGEYTLKIIDEEFELLIEHQSLNGTYEFE